MTLDTAHQVATAFRDQWADSLQDLDTQTTTLFERMLNRLSVDDEVAVEVHEAETDRWTVGVVLRDRIGMLSVVSGLFASAGLDITRADTFTVVTDTPVSQELRQSRPPWRTEQRTRRRRRETLPAPSPRPQALMMFSIRPFEGSTPDLERMKGDLEVLARQASAGEIESARSTVIDRFAHAMRRPERLPEGQPDVEIGTDSTSSPDHTLLTIRSLDTTGFLFTFTTALASLRMNVLRAKVRTVSGRVENTFWLTDAAGGKIESEHLSVRSG